MDRCVDIREAMPSVGCPGHHTLQLARPADQGLSQEAFVQEREGEVTASPGPLTIPPATPAVVSKDT